MLDEPWSSSLMGSTCRGSHLLHLGRWGSHRGDRSAALGRDLSPLPQSLSHCAQTGRGRAGNPPNHPSWLFVGPFSGKAGCDSSSVSLAVSLIPLIPHPSSCCPLVLAWEPGPAWHCGGSVFPPELRLGRCVTRGGCRGPRGHGFLLGGGHCSLVELQG